MKTRSIAPAPSDRNRNFSSACASSPEPSRSIRPGFAYARLADALIDALFARVCEEFASNFGRIDGGDAAVVATGQARRTRNDGGLRSRSDPALRRRPRRRIDGRRTRADDRAILRAPDAAAHLGAVRADGRRSVLRGGFPPAPIRQQGPDRGQSGELFRLSGQRSLDLGANGLDPRAGRRGTPRIFGPRRSGDSIGAHPPARARELARRRAVDAAADRKREGFEKPLGRQTGRGRADRHRIHRAISDAAIRRRSSRTVSPRRPRSPSPVFATSACSTRARRKR